MAILKSGSLSPYGAPVNKRAVLGNSIVATEGDSMKPSSGFAILGTAGASVLGHIDSIITELGVGVSDNGASADFTGTFTAASDNQTVAKVSALIDVSKLSLYSAEVDVAISTTTG